MYSQLPSPPSDVFSNLDINKLKDELQSEGKIGCPTTGCNDTFKSIWGLKFHLKKNTCNAPRFKCDKCDRAFQSRIILQQHICGPSKGGTVQAVSLITDTNEETGHKESLSIKQKNSTPCISKGDTEETTSTKDKNENSRPEESSSFKQKSSTPCTSKGDPEKTTSTKIKNEKPGPEESSSFKQKGSTPSTSKGITEKICTSTKDNNEKTGPTKDLSIKQNISNPCSSKGDTVKVIGKSTKETGSKESSSIKQDILTPKRKKGRPANPKTTAIKTPQENPIKQNDSFMQQKEVRATSTGDNENVGSTTKDTKETPGPTNPKTAATKTPKENPIKENDSFMQQKEARATSTGDNENVGSTTKDTKETPGPKQDTSTPTRKRGRPPKSKTATAKTPQEKQNKDSMNSEDDPLMQEKDVKPGKKRRRPTKAKTDSPTEKTPNNKAVRRTSGRSATKNGKFRIICISVNFLLSGLTYLLGIVICFSIFMCVFNKFPLVFRGVDSYLP
jgi:hypothetical protein